MALRTVQVQIPGEALDPALYRIDRVMRAWETQGTPVWTSVLVEQNGSDDSFTVTLESDALPKVGSSTILGTVADGIVTPVVGYPDSLMPTLPSEVRCSVCGTRREKTLYLLQGEDGSVSLVGRACLERQYASTVRHARGSNLVDGLIADVTDLVTRSVEWIAASPHYDTDTVLAAALVAVDRDGYVPRRRSYDTQPTSESMEELLRLGADGVHPEVADRLLAAAVLRACILDEMSDDTDFLVKAKRALARPTLTRHAFGLIGALPTAYSSFERRATDEAEGRSTAPEPFASGHVGEVGERVTVQAQVKVSRLLDSGSTLVVFRTADGHRMTWFATAPSLVFQVGAEGALTATVKAHKSFNGVDDTSVSRCVLRPS